MAIPFNNFGGEGETLHFAHANGYPTLSYKSLLELWANHYNVIGMNARPTWQDSKPSEVKNWTKLADDLIRFLDSQNLKGIVGAGHSLGAITTLIAAVKRPDLFKKIILIEPVILMDEAYSMMKFLPIFLRKYLTPPAKISSKRKDIWASREAAYEALKGKRVFSKISKNVFMDYINYGLKDTDDGKVTLTFSKEWETQIYCTAPNPWKYLNAIQCPMLIVKAQYSNVITQKTWDILNDLPDHIQCKEVMNSTHLLPFELLEELSTIMYEFIEDK